MKEKNNNNNNSNVPKSQIIICLMALPRASDRKHRKSISGNTSQPPTTLLPSPLNNKEEVDGGSIMIQRRHNENLIYPMPLEDKVFPHRDSPENRNLSCTYQNC